MSLYGRTPQPPPQQNQNLQWERFTMLPGNSVSGRSPQTGFQIANVQIDNNTGAWLQLEPGGFLIPPYTLGWSTNLIPPATSISVTPSVGPTGQGISTAGTNVSVAMYNEYLGNQVGSEYTSTQQQILSVSSSGIVLHLSGPVTFTLVPGVADQRVRLFNLSCKVSTLTGAIMQFPLDSYSTVAVFPSSSTPSNGIPLFVGNPVYYDNITFGSGYDLPVGDSLNVFGATGWADTAIAINATFQYV